MSDMHTTIKAELVLELRKQMQVFNERAEKNDEAAKYMSTALALKSLNNERFPAFIWSFGLVETVEAVVRKYAAQDPSARLEWWHYVMSSVVRSDIVVAIAGKYTSAVTFTMRCASAASTVAAAATAVAALFSATVPGIESIGAVLAFIRTSGSYVQWALSHLEPFAVRFVLSVLLKSAALYPHTQSLAPRRSVAEVRRPACAFGFVLKRKLLIACNNILLSNAVSGALGLERSVGIALDALLPDATVREWDPTGWSIYRMLVMHIQSTGGPESMRRKLADSNAGVLIDTARTLRASSVLGQPEFLVAFFLRQVGMGDAVEVARCIVRLALLYTFMECGKSERPFWEGAPSVMESAAAGGNANAEYVLGRTLHDGHGVAQDFALAAGWYRRAARRGHVLAQRSLAELYESGRGVEKDAAAAAVLRRQAAAAVEEETAESEASVVAFAARKYIEAAFGPDTPDRPSPPTEAPGRSAPAAFGTDASAGLSLRAEALGQYALIESATTALIEHYELIVDKHGWYGETSANAEKGRTMARQSRSGLRLWQQFVMSEQSDRVVGTHIRREMLKVPESSLDAVAQAAYKTERWTGALRALGDLLTSACLFGIRTCMSESYERAPIAPCLLRDFPARFAVRFREKDAPRLLGLGFRDAEVAGYATCKLPTELVPNDAPERFPEPEALRLGAAFHTAVHGWAAKTRSRVVKDGARAEDEETGVAYRIVRAFDGSKLAHDGVECAGMQALARSVIDDIMRVFRFQAHRWAGSDEALLYTVWKLDSRIKREVLWILAEFADAESTYEKTTADAADVYKASRLWGVFCVSPFLDALVDEFGTALKRRRSLTESFVRMLGRNVDVVGQALSALSNVPTSHGALKWRADEHLAALCEVVPVCMLAALRSVPYQKLYLVLPFLRHGGSSRACAYYEHV